MNIKLFLEIVGEFFDQMYAGDIYDYSDIEEINDIEYGFYDEEEDYEKILYLNLCSIFNPFYKLDDKIKIN